MWQKRVVARVLGVALALALLHVVGCGGVRTYPVRGRVIFDKGDVGRLTGSNVEFVSQADANVRAYGAIRADGSFAMKTRYEGKFLSGVPEGAYRARISLVGEED